MICPKCGENNSANFRFCGMCGTSLEPRRPAGAPRTAGVSEAPRSFQSDTVSARTPEKAAVGATHSSRPTGGSGAPSFLGLNEPYTARNGTSSAGSNSAEESLPGLDSFFEQEEQGVSARGIILLLVLLAALGAGGWWAYTHYNGVASAPGAKPQAANQAPATPPPASQPGASETSADNSPSGPKDSEASSSKAAGSLPGTGTTASSAGPSQPATESGKSAPPPAVEPAVGAKSNRNPPVSPKAPAQARRPDTNHAAHGQQVGRADTKPSASPTPVAPSVDKGDAEFKKGEAYLYGRGIAENCNEAIKNLKEASAKQNAKARSAFGTMYATGHCVPRDLPTSYSWFAQALRVDPNNQILEKDLTAVWNQMTPPERQMASKNK